MNELKLFENVELEDCYEVLAQSKQQAILEVKQLKTELEIKDFSFLVSADNKVNGRKLWEALQSKQQFSDWIKLRIDGFEEGLEVFHKVMKNPAGGRPTTEYELTLNTAKHICMLEHNEIGKKIRQYFIDVEKAAVIKAPTTLKEALQLALKQQEEIEQQQKQLEEAKPKVEFFDAVADSKDAKDMREVAALINKPNLGRNKLFSLLREKNVLYSKNIPYREYQDRLTLIHKSRAI
jgi:anti-repressor protein